jgi:hypothetical protein
MAKRTEREEEEKRIGKEKGRKLLETMEGKSAET